MLSCEILDSGFLWSLCATPPTVYAADYSSPQMTKPYLWQHLCCGERSCFSSQKKKKKKNAFFVCLLLFLEF